MKTIAIIPARYGSSRFPGKPLALLGDKPLIEWAFRAATQVFDEVVIATDHQLIVRSVEAIGGKAVLTSTAHRNGTSRVAEALRLLHTDADIVVNLQGDEPFLEARHLQRLLRCFDSYDTGIATLVTKIDKTAASDAIFNPNRVKVVMDCNDNAMYFSRAAIPYIQGTPVQDWQDNATYYGHIGIYAFRADLIQQLAALPPSALEQAESLEQLRWLQHGYRIKCAVVDATHISIDTPDDLTIANQYLKNKNLPQ